MVIKLLRIILTLITVLNGSPDLCTYIDCIVKNELSDPEIELELTEKQKKWLKIGLIVASVVFSIFLVYVLKNYHIQPENIENSNINEIEPKRSSEQINSNLCNSTEENIVLDNILNVSLDEYEAIRIQAILAEEAIMKSNPFLFNVESNNPQENFDKAVSELRAYMEENKGNKNLLKLPKFLELEKKVNIAYSILNKGKIE